MNAEANQATLAHLRTHDFDWYAALHFAPANKRPALVALFAFLAEIARIRSLVSEPMPGEIRLQWWRDALSGTSHGAVEANPLAAALLQTIEDHSLPTGPLLAVLEARTFDLYDDVMPATGDFEGYAGEVWSGPMSLAAALLSGQSAASFATLAGHGGVALTVARLLQDFPRWSQRGQCFLPADLLAEHGLDRDALRAPSAQRTATLQAFASYGQAHLDKAMQGAQALAQEAQPIWLPLALARYTLTEAQSWADHADTKTLTAPRWRRLYRLWRASKKGVCA